MNAFLFPGQGSQEIGMGTDLFKADEAFRELVRHASERVGTDLERICRRGPERELVRTRHLQPLLVCVSLGYFRHLTAAGLQPDLVLGHSLGEITALAAAGVVTFTQAIDMAAERGRLMDEAAGKVDGGMLAVTLHDRARLLEWVATQPRDQLVLASDNAPTQLVLAGQVSALEAAARFVSDHKLGACRRLSVAGPWHSPHMVEAQRQFEAWLASVPFEQPRVPVVFNVTAQAEQDPGLMRGLAVRNLSEPVQWRSSMEQLHKLSPTALYEVGPGRVLCGLARANGLGDPIRTCPVGSLRGVELAVGGDRT